METSLQPPNPLRGGQNDVEERGDSPPPPHPPPPRKSLHVLPYPPKLVDLPEDVITGLFQYMYIDEACRAKSTSKHFERLITASLMLPRQMAVLPRRWKSIDIVNRVLACRKVQRWRVDRGLHSPREELTLTQWDWQALRDRGLRLSRGLRSLTVDVTEYLNWLDDNESLATFVHEPMEDFPKLERATLWTCGCDILQFLDDWSHVGSIDLHVYMEPLVEELAWPEDGEVLKKLSTASNISSLSFEFSDDWEIFVEKDTTREVLLSLAMHVPKHLSALHFEIPYTRDVEDPRQELEETMSEVEKVVLARFPQFSAKRYFADLCGVKFSCTTSRVEM